MSIGVTRKYLSLTKVFLHLGFISTCYLLLLFFHKRHLCIVRDNWGYQMPDYVYICNSLLHFSSFPRWMPWAGGVPFGLTLIPFFNFLPHKLLGYLIYLYLPFSPVQSYTLTIILGMLITAFGWWLFLYKLTGSRISASIGGLMLLLGGTGITIFHQEQILATMVWMPWIALTILKIKENFNFILILAILTGFSMTVHQPPLQLLALIFLLLSLIFTGNLKWNFLVEQVKKGKGCILALSILLFFLAASPTFYTIKTQKDFLSPFRHGEVQANTLDGYMKLGAFGLSSAPLKYFKSYTASIKAPRPLPYEMPIGDSSAFFVTVIGLILAGIGVKFKRKIAIPILIMLAFNAWAVLGFNAYLPQILFILKFPYIEFFREWYHFFVIINFCLSALGALGVLVLLQSKKIKKKQLILIGIVLIMIIESRFHFRRYLKVIDLWKPPSYDSSQNKNQFLEFIKNKVDKPDYNTIHYSYSDYYFIYNESNKKITGNPYVVPYVYNDYFVLSKRDLTKKIFANGFYPCAATITLPSQQIKDSDFFIADLPSEINSIDFSSLKGKSLENNYIFPRNDYMLTPLGATLKGNVPRSSLVVFPYGFKMNFKAFLNGRETITFPVYNGGMMGIFVPKGNFDLKLIVPFSWYFLTLFIQGSLLLFILFFSCWVSINTLSNENKIS